MIETINVIASGILAFMAGWAAVSQKVRTGIVMQIGLVLVSLGFLGTFLLSVQPYSYLTGATNSLVHIGLVLCGVGYAQRSRRSGPKRRVSDWMDL